MKESVRRKTGTFTGEALYFRPHNITTCCRGNASTTILKLLASHARCTSTQIFFFLTSCHDRRITRKRNSSFESHSYIEKCKRLSYNKTQLLSCLNFFASVLEMLEKHKAELLGFTHLQPVQLTSMILGQEIQTQNLPAVRVRGNYSTTVPSGQECKILKKKNCKWMISRL